MEAGSTVCLLSAAFVSWKIVVFLVWLQLSRLAPWFGGGGSSCYVASRGCRPRRLASLRYISFFICLLGMRGQFGLRCHLPNHSPHDSSRLSDAYVLDAIREKLNNDGAVLVDVVPMAIKFGSDPDYCTKRLVPLMDDGITVLQKFWSTNKNSLRIGGWLERGFHVVFEISCPGKRVDGAGFNGHRLYLKLWM